MAFAKTRTLYPNDIINFFQAGPGQNQNIGAASGTGKLSLRSLSSYSKTAAIVSDTKYEVVAFNFQAILEANIKIPCPARKAAAANKNMHFSADQII